MKVTKYRDKSNDNAAVIESVKMRAYKGSAYKTGYRLIMFDTGADDFIFHISCYESRKDAEQALYSMGLEWHKIG